MHLLKPFVKRLAVVLIFVSAFTLQSFTGNDNDDEIDYDEISLLVNVQGVGNAELPALIKNDVAYLSVTGLFDYLKIKNSISKGLDSISGYILDSRKMFLIEKKSNRIFYNGNIFPLNEGDLVKTQTDLYLRSDYFGKVFGLECLFNFRSLSVILKPGIELPVMREMKLENMRTNMLRLKGEIKADTFITAKHAMFKLGAADWSLVGTQYAEGFKDTRLYLGLGSVIAGGETNIAINYNNNFPFREKEQFYQWRYVDNANHLLRQSIAGKINAQSIASLFFPVVGVQFTNTPTTFRRSFGTYTISNYTDPHWMVELYVNNVLIDYAEADATGFYSFQVPLVYGNSAVKLRFYGPNGEQKFTEETISIPFNFVPLHQFEYTVSAGVVEDSMLSRYSRVNFNYGVSKRFTFGAGAEYLSSVTPGKYMPFLNASLRLSNNILLAGDYTYGVRSRAVLNYRLPSNLQFELDYTRYEKNQKAINTTFLEERKAVISYPIRSNKFTAFTRFTLYNIILPSSKYTTVEGLISGVLFGVSTNFTTYALLTHDASPYLYSNLSMSFRIKGKIIFTPQIQYEYNQHKFMSVKGEAGKYFKRNGYINVFYENNYKSNFQSVGIGIKYNFSFAQTGLTARRSNYTSTLVQTASGSFLFDGKSHYLSADNRSSVGKGGIIILPFIDINRNGKRDAGEPKAAGLKVQLSYGFLKYNYKDTTIAISQLESYTNSIIKLNPQFENISWQIKNKTLSVAVDPNQFKLVEVPVTVMNEVTGTVYFKNNETQKPLGRIVICFYNSDSSFAGKTISEDDGYFNFSGLAPGKYTAKISPEQLLKINMTASPAQVSFTIAAKIDGDVADNIEFVLREKNINP